ncbi:MAG: hypothetical protein CL828_05045 [Crocinitomicaceae bacterium]|nr:hypothetical protein [Crocinitomicaceae bacterium]
MRLLYIALACLLSVSLSAQEQVITYPYNPDVDNDSLIDIPDALEFFTLFGNEFIPEPVAVDGVVITEWLEQNGVVNNLGFGDTEHHDFFELDWQQQANASGYFIPLHLL